MTSSSIGRLSKRERAERRRQLARQRLLWRRVRAWGIVGVLIGIPVLWGYDCTGPEELVQAEVVSTQRWRHVTGSGPHTHIRATLLIDGLSKATIDRADGYERGDWIPVWVRRGRVTGWPYFQDLAQPDEQAPEGDAADEEPE